ncbi:hypothetical protein [Pontibacter chitinilyticus]
MKRHLHFWLFLFATSITALAQQVTGGSIIGPEIIAVETASIAPKRCKA